MQSLSATTLNESVTTYIDDIEYTFSNSASLTNQMSWSKNLSTGELTLQGDYFTITGQTDIAHNIYLDGRMNTLTTGNLADTVKVTSSELGAHNVIKTLGGDDNVTVEYGHYHTIQLGDGNNTFDASSSEDTSQITVSATGNGTNTFNYTDTQLGRSKITGGSGTNIFNINVQAPTCTIDGSAGSSNTFNLNGSIGLNVIGGSGDDTFNID